MRISYSVQPGTEYEICYALEMWRLQHRFWWAIAGLTAVWLLWMTLRPNPEVAANLAVLTEPAMARGISYFWLIDIAGNIVVFMPLGAATALALNAQRTLTSRIRIGTLAGLALSCSIELLQRLSASRVPSLIDILLNTAGTALGALVATWLYARLYSGSQG